MLPDFIQTLLDALPENFEAPNARQVYQQVCMRVMRDPEAAVGLLRYIGGSEEHDAQTERVMRLFSSVLDEARMAQENGKAVGTAFLSFIEQELVAQKDDVGLASGGRLLLASCWSSAGLDVPDAVAADMSEIEATSGVSADMEMPDLAPIIESLLANAARGSADELLALQTGFSEVLATLPIDARRLVVRQVVAHSKPITGDLGCALLLDRRVECRRGAIDGLKDRLTQGILAPELVGRLTIIRSWIIDADTQAGIDSIVQQAMRLGDMTVGAAKAPKIHRVLSSLIDGVGGQSLAVVLQVGGARKVAVLLIKRGYGVKDAYLVPCTSATEQRNLVEMISTGANMRDVSLEYVANVIAFGLSDGLENNCAPAPGLIEVVEALGLHDLRPRPASVSDIVALVDPEGQLDAMTPQARGRLISASGDWDMISPMIADSWFEDSDEIADALGRSKSPSAAQKAFWRVLEGRRDHWATVIARTGYLMRVLDDPHALQFAAVAQALADGRALKKTPIFDLIFDLSIEVWQHRAMGAPVDSPPLPDGDLGPIEVLQDVRAPQGMQMYKPSAEQPGELEKLLAPAQLTEPWLQGYLMGVCTAPEFVSPSAWMQVLMNIIGPELGAGHDLQRLLDLLLLRYNKTLDDLKVPVGKQLLPKPDAFIAIWADGYLTAWEGNKGYWPKSKLGKADQTARKLLETATFMSVDIARFRKEIPNWLRRRFEEQTKP